MKGDLSLLDESSSLESIVEDFKLLDGQVPIHFDYNSLDSYSGGREPGHLGSVLSEGGLVDNGR
jgi:hypothetical protein